MKCSAKLIFPRPTTNCKCWLTVTYLQLRCKQGNSTVAVFGTHYWHRHETTPELLYTGQDMEKEKEEVQRVKVRLRVTEK
jgi:hypothetical protein